MKLSACVSALFLSALTLASPASKPKPGKCTLKAGPQPSSYGMFTHPIIPPLPPNQAWTPIKPTDGNSTSNDATWTPVSPNTPDHRGNWAPGYDINTDATKKWPETGRTVRYTFTITNTTLAPDGIPKQMLVVNGQYPGPTIDANWGDWIEVTVVNGLKNNGTDMHWHGFQQMNNNLADGAGGATECPIAPGNSKVYRFQATSFGSSWYHSHFSTQYGDGVVGPIIVRGPSSANYDIDLGTVLVSDWYDLTAPQEDWFAHRRGPPAFRNYLINGQNIAIDGSAGKRAKFTFTPGKKHLIRLVNTGMDALFKMSIDGHKMKVIQADFVPIVPYYTNEVAMNIGQRYHVIVEADQKPSNYYFRAMAATDCTQTSNPGTGNANAIVSYSNALNIGILPNSTATNHTNTCVDEPLPSLVPIVSQSVDSTNFAPSAVTEDVNLSGGGGPPGGGPPGGGPPGGGPPGGAPPGGAPPAPAGNKRQAGLPDNTFHWSLGGVSQVLDWNNPVIGQATQGNTTYDTLRNVVSLNQSNAWVYFIIQNRFFVPHPMHLHGHDFNLLGQGNGIFDSTTDTASLNFKNPARRDVATLPASGWTVIAFETDNPGAWLLHCHIAWHAGEGLALNFLERPQDIPAKYGKMTAPGSDYARQCKAWQSYQSNAVWPQYDSGLKKRLADGTEIINWAESKFIQMKEKMYMRKRGVYSAAAGVGMRGLQNDVVRRTL